MGVARVVGLTGDVGAGKSTVRRWLEDRGAAALDADALVRRMLSDDTAVARAVALRFGDQVISDGSVDRAALAQRVFQDGDALADLERILHPPVIGSTLAWLADVEVSVPAAVVEAVKLVEAGMDAWMSQVWLVVCERRVRRQRLIRRGWSAEEAERRMAAGTALAPRLARADVVVDNSRAWDATERQLAVAWRHLTGSGGYHARGL